MSMTRAAITNPQVGELIGMTFTGVSRIRSGARRPSLHIMLRIRDVFGWDMNEQANARRSGNYHEQFEKVLIGIYGDSEHATASA